MRLAGNIQAGQRIATVGETACGALQLAWDEHKQTQTPAFGLCAARDECFGKIEKGWSCCECCDWLAVFGSCSRVLGNDGHARERGGRRWVLCERYCFDRGSERSFLVGKLVLLLPWFGSHELGMGKGKKEEICFIAARTRSNVLLTYLLLFLIRQLKFYYSLDVLCVFRSVPTALFCFLNCDLSGSVLGEKRIASSACQ